jgi:hypothetical protein
MFFNMGDNTPSDQLCNYGYYAKEIGLAVDQYKFDCNKPGINPFDFGSSVIALCDDHFKLVNK